MQALAEARRRELDSLMDFHGLPNGFPNALPNGFPDWRITRIIVYCPLRGFAFV